MVYHYIIENIRDEKRADEDTPVLSLTNIMIRKQNGGLVMQIEKYILTVAETAALMGYSSGKIYRLIHKDALLAYKDDCGRIWHIPVTSITSYVSSRIHKHKSER